MEFESFIEQDDGPLEVIIVAIGYIAMKMFMAPLEFIDMGEPK